MSQNQSHVLCEHDNTKAARAKCRKARKAHSESMRQGIQEIVDSYFTNVGSCEEIGVQLSRLASGSSSESLKAAARGYYEEDLDMEDIIALAQKAVWEV